MGGIDAPTNVATMADAHPVWDWPDRQLIRDPVRPFAAASKAEHAIADTPRDVACPEPAAIWRFLDSAPKARLYRTRTPRDGIALGRAVLGVNARRRLKRAAAAATCKRFSITPITGAAVPATKVIGAGDNCPPAVARALPSDDSDAG